MLMLCGFLHGMGFVEAWIGGGKESEVFLVVDATRERGYGACLFVRKQRCGNEAFVKG